MGIPMTMDSSRMAGVQKTHRKNRLVLLTLPSAPRTIKMARASGVVSSQEIVARTVMIVLSATMTMRRGSEKKNKQKNKDGTAEDGGVFCASGTGPAADSME